MKLIIGLGNPGNEYSQTRHNVGFMFLDKICGEDFILNKKLNALEKVDYINDEKIIYVKPLSFMNLSGDVVLGYVNFYKIELADVLVIQDDLDMDLANYKILFKRGPGGHNGIKDIINKLNSNAFYRLKIGISKNDIAMRDYVLSKFSSDELNKLNDIFDKLKDLVLDFVNLSSNSFVQKYNTRDDN